MSGDLKLCWHSKDRSFRGQRHGCHGVRVESMQQYQWLVCIEIPAFLQSLNDKPFCFGDQTIEINGDFEEFSENNSALLGLVSCGFPQKAPCGFSRVDCQVRHFSVPTSLHTGGWRNTTCRAGALCGRFLVLGDFSIKNSPPKSPSLNNQKPIWIFVATQSHRQKSRFSTTDNVNVELNAVQHFKSLNFLADRFGSKGKVGSVLLLFSIKFEVGNSEQKDPVCPVFMWMISWWFGCGLGCGFLWCLYVSFWDFYLPKAWNLGDWHHIHGLSCDLQRYFADGFQETPCPAAVELQTQIQRWVKTFRQIEKLSKVSSLCPIRNPLDFPIAMQSH